MNVRILSLLSAFTVLLGEFASLRAQVVADGMTNILSNTTNSLATVTVGTNGSFTLLVLSNNALLTNSGNGSIGLNVTAKSNEVRLISPSARWRMGNNLYVGSNGAVSRLVITNGALVENFNGVLGNVLASSNNLARVTGSGSLWSNRGDLAVGFSGRENQLIVSNGGFVFNRFGYLGQQPGGSNNVARVTGSGSIWSNQFWLTVGGNDRSNRLIVEAGGLVTCSDGFVSGSSSSGNNEVLVTGPGSLWSNRFSLYMGDVAGRNRLVVSNGATLWSGGSILGTLSLALSNQVIVTGPGSVWTNESSLSLGDGSQGNRVDVSNGGRLECVDGLIGQTLAANSNGVFLTGNGSAWNNRATLIVGNNGSGNTLTASHGAIITASNLLVGITPNALGNRVAVDGGALRVTNAAGTGVLDVRRGAVSLRAGSVNADRLILTNVAGSLELAGGTLITRSAALTNIGGFSVSGSATNPAIWDVRAGTGIHALAAGLSVGSSFSFNQMLITNGGILTSGVSYIGSNPGSSSNLVLLSGAGSKWTAADLDVGNGGAFNQLVVSNGATVEDFEGSLGKNSGSSNNLAVVTGAGSLWTNRDEMYVGYQGSGNQLVISNGGTAFAMVTRFLGHANGAVSNNAAIVTGAGSRWIGPGNLEIGGPAAFCRLLVTNGGLVANNFGLIGSGSDSSNNLAVIAGAGSTWSNAMEIHVGDNGDGNQLVVSNGGFVNAASGEIGSEIGSADNQVTVTGAGSTWTNTGLLYVGNYGVSNRLVVFGGGAVYSSDGYVGSQPSSSFNLALVTGVGSSWSNRFEMYVGQAGDGNHLVITNGGTVFANANRYVGYDIGSASNSAIVTDPGSRWLGDDSLYVGVDGVFNRLEVRNGGQVTSGLGTVGGLSIGNNNLVVVADPGSSWTNHLDLNCGENGSGNRLAISNAATLATLWSGYIGRNNTAASNSITLTDPGTRWLVTSNLYIGSNGPFNRLVVSNGARLENAFGIVGEGVSSSNNTVIVTGSGSVWSNANQLNLGGRGGANHLVVSNGALVRSVGGFLGGNSASGGHNEAVITGPGSFWRSTGSLFVGTSTSGNRLVVSNGGWMFNSTASIGSLGEDNEVTVTGAGSTWTNGGTLIVGASGRRSRLMVGNGGVVHEPFDLRMGENATSTNNRIIVDGGTLVMASPTLGLLDVRRGTNVLNAGLIYVGRILLVTNSLGVFEFNGGTLQTGGTVHSNGQVFTVGNGANAATLQLLSGIHGFANNLLIASNATLTGNGTVTGVLTTQPGGRLSPGVPVGNLVLSNSPSLQGTTIMEIGNNGATYNDRIQVVGPLTYGGSLVVTNIDFQALAIGNRFALFDATSYSGAFTNLVLPPLGPGLAWTNKLTVDGSIEVIAALLPTFTTFSISGSNMIFAGTNGVAGQNYAVLTATNVTAPVANWQSLFTNQFGAGGQFSFTNGINFNEPQRFFRLRTP